MNNKSLLKNSIFNIIYKGFTALFPLLTTSYIANVLLPEGVGRVEYALTVVSYFVTVASLGIPNYGIKAIAQANKNERINVFLELFTINSASTIFCIVAYYLFIFINPYFAERINLFSVVGIMLILNIFNTEWFFQGIEEYSYIAIRSVIMKIFSFIGIVLFVKSKDDYTAYAFILCIATAGNYVLNIVQLRKYVSFEKYNIHIKKHLLPVLIMFASTVATQVYTMLDSIMLEYYHGEIYVGYYTNAVKIVRMIYTVSIAMVVPFYPRISNNIKQRHINETNILLSKGLRMILIIALPAVVGLLFTADWIVIILFGEAFSPSVITLKILSPLVIIFSCSYFLGHIILMSFNKEKILLYSTIIGAIINFILNIICIPLFKHNGAALSSLIAEIIVMLFVICKSKRYYSLIVSNRYKISLIISLFMMCILLFTLKSFMSISLVNLFILYSAFSVIYFILLYALKNEEVIYLLKK